MADPKEAEVVVPDEGTVTVDVSDNPELAAETVEAKPEAEEVQPAPKEKKDKVPRARLKDDGNVQLGPDVQARLAEVDQKLQEAEAARRAAEATANSERQERQRLEALARQKDQEAQDAFEAVQQSQLQSLERGIDAATKEVSAYEQQLQQAYEAGEFAKAASLQTKLGKATATLDRLEAQKADFEANPPTKKQPTTEGRVTEPSAGGNPVDQYLSQFSLRDQQWLRSHPECLPPQVGGNAQANAKMMSGHYDSIAKGFQPGTDEYYHNIELYTGHRKPPEATVDPDEDREHTRAAPQPKPRPKAQPSAPPTRAPPGAGGRPMQRTVTLSPQEQEMAKMSFPNLKPQEAFAQYARNKLELEAEGKLGRLTH